MAYLLCFFVDKHSYYVRLLLFLVKVTEKIYDLINQNEQVTSVWFRSEFIGYS